MPRRGLASAGSVGPQDRREGEAAEGWKKVGAAMQCQVRRSTQGTGSGNSRDTLGLADTFITD